MSLGEAFLGVHADLAPFKEELATGVRAALAETQATLRVSPATGAAGTTTTNTVRTVTDDAALKAQSALQAQILRDELANQQVAAAAQAELETVRVAEAKAANDAIRITNQLTADQLKADLASQVTAEKAAAAARVAAEKAANDAIRAANAEQVAAQKNVQKAIADTAAAYKKSAAAAVEAGKTLSTVFTAPTLLIGAAAVKQAFDFQTAVNKVINLSQNFGQTAQQVTATVLAQSNATGTGATELANAYYKIAAAGYTAKTAQDLLAESAKLSALNLGDSSKVADALVSVLNNYGASNISAAKASSTFLSIIQNSKFTPDQLAGSLGRVLAVGQQLGISFPQVGAVIASLSHSTAASADVAVTGLVALTTNLIQATKSTGAASKELKTLGLNGQDLLKSLAVGGPAATLETIRQAFVKTGVAVHTTKAEFATIAQNLGESVAQVKATFDKIDLGQLQKLFPNRKAFLNFLGLTDENNAAAIQAAKNVATGVAGNVDAALKNKLSTPAGRVEFFLNQIRNDFIALGDQLLPIAARIFGDVAKFIDNLKAKFDALSPSQKKQLEDFILLAASIGPVLFVGGKLLQLFGELNRLLKASPIVVLADAFLLAYTNSKAFRDIVNGLAGDLKPVLDHMTAIKDVTIILGAEFVGLKIGQLITSLGLLAGAFRGVAVAEGEAEAAAALFNPVSLTLAAGAGLVAAAYFGTTAALNNFFPSVVTTKEKIDAMTAALGPAVDKIKQLAGPTGIASAALHHVADEALGLINATDKTGHKVLELAAYLTHNLGLSADQARAGMESVGFSADDATKALAAVKAGIDNIPDASFKSLTFTTILQTVNATSGNGNNNLGTATGGGGLSGAQASRAGRPGTATVSPPASGTQLNNTNVNDANTTAFQAAQAAAAQAAANLTGGGGGGGGGGSKGPTAAQTAAANFAASIKSALSTLTDAIAGFATATESQVESDLEALNKAITAAFKADKTTEPTALVRLIAKDTKQLEALATQRDTLTKEITAADAFAASTLTSAQGFGALTAIASTLAVFQKATANLSVLHIVLPGDLATQNPIGQLQTSLNARLAALTKFQSDIQKVIHEGLNAGAVQDLIAGGVEANGSLAAALAGASPAQIAALNSAQAGINAIAKKLSANAGDAAAQAGVDAGKAVADGILQGLKDRNASLLKAMTTLADALVAQIKKDLKIKSPSQVMRGLGVHIGTGLEHGILATHGAIESAALGMARRATPGLSSFSMPGGMGPVGSASSFSPVATYNQQKEIHAPVTIHAYGGGASAEEIAAAHGRMIARAMR